MFGATDGASILLLFTQVLDIVYAGALNALAKTTIVSIVVRLLNLPASAEQSDIKRSEKYLSRRFDPLLALEHNVSW